MKEMTKARKQRFSTLVIALGFSLAASSGIAGAVDKPLPAQLGVPSTAGVNRYELAAQVLDRWQPIAAELGQSPETWREMFATQLGLMDDSMLRTIAAVKADAGNAKASYARFTQAFRNAAMQAYVNAKSEKGQPKLGSAVEDFIYVPVTPCRLVDTRNVGGPIAFGTARNFFYYTNAGAFNFGTSQGGALGAASVVCPETVFTDNAPRFAAAAITVTVISPTAAGNLVAWGGAAPIPTSSVLNWTAGQVLANTTIIPGGGRAGAGPGGAIQDFALYYNGPAGSAQFTADVVGYFVENQATALSCVNVLSAVATNVAANADACADPPACPAGYTQTGPVFDNNSFGGLVLSQLNSNAAAGLAICGRNTSAAAKVFFAGSICCRVPGR